jgi:hypothetical protein
VQSLFAYVCTYIHTGISATFSPIYLHVCMYLCMYVPMYVCMYICMYVRHRYNLTVLKVLIPWTLHELGWFSYFKVRLAGLLDCVVGNTHRILSLVSPNTVCNREGSFFCSFVNFYITPVCMYACMYVCMYANKVVSLPGRFVTADIWFSQPKNVDLYPSMYICRYVQYKSIYFQACPGSFQQGINFVVHIGRTWSTP